MDYVLDNVFLFPVIGYRGHSFTLYFIFIFFGGRGGCGKNVGGWGWDWNPFNSILTEGHNCRMVKSRHIKSLSLFLNLTMSQWACESGCCWYPTRYSFQLWKEWWVKLTLFMSCIGVLVCLLCCFDVWCG